MSKPYAVTLAYIDAQPASAAADLSRLPPNDASELIDLIPVRYAVKIIELASSWSGAGMLMHLNTSKASSILCEIPSAKATEVLRLMAIEPREKIIRSAPRKLKRQFQISLSYPDDTVGALMVMEILSFQSETMVHDVLFEIRKNLKIKSDLVFVVSPKHELVGVVDALTLLRSNLDDQLADIMSCDVPSLSARSRLSTITDIDAWDKFDVLPVLSRRDYLLGSLSRSALADKTNVNIVSEPIESASLTAAVTSAFIYSAVEFAKMLADGGANTKPQKSHRGAS